MNESIRPTEQEIMQWIVHTAAHSYHIEYFLQKLQIGAEDPDRPHDLVHAGNKFEWPAVKGLALQFRKNGHNDFYPQIMASREYHRQQFHHRMWNQYYPSATEDAMKMGAVDAICSLLEPREYQGGCHSWKEISQIISGDPIHKIGWLRWMCSEMKQIGEPAIKGITKLSEIPRQGIAAETYDIVLGRADETLKELEQTQGYRFNILPKII